MPWDPWGWKTQMSVLFWLFYRYNAILITTTLLLALGSNYLKLVNVRKSRIYYLVVSVFLFLFFSTEMKALILFYCFIILNVFRQSLLLTEGWKRLLTFYSNVRARYYPFRLPFLFFLDLPFGSYNYAKFFSKTSLFDAMISIKMVQTAQIPDQRKRWQDHGSTSFN